MAVGNLARLSVLIPFFCVLFLLIVRYIKAILLRWPHRCCFFSLLIIIHRQELVLLF